MASMPSELEFEDTFDGTAPDPGRWIPHDPRTMVALCYAIPAL
jgi:hypothetical protein